MNASLSSTQERRFQARNNVRAALTALLAIISRDLLVMRREALTFLVQMLVQPLFFLFVFGKVLPTIGAASAGFSTLLLPGIVAFTVFITTLQGPSVELARDLGFTREIEDRLLAPLPIALVAVEKILLSALRGLIAGAFVFPLAFWILGSGYQVRTDLLGVLIGLMILVALVGARLAVGGRGPHPNAASDFRAGVDTADLYQLRLLSLGLTGRDQVVPDTDAVQPAHLRRRGHAVRDDSAHTWASVADAGDWLGSAGALRCVHLQSLGRHPAGPSARGELSSSC
jgi:ABC-2 type transporter